MSLDAVKHILLARSVVIDFVPSVNICDWVLSEPEIRPTTVDSSLIS